MELSLLRLDNETISRLIVDKSKETFTREGTKIWILAYICGADLDFRRASSQGTCLGNYTSLWSRAQKLVYLLGKLKVASAPPSGVAWWLPRFYERKEYFLPPNCNITRFLAFEPVLFLYVLSPVWISSAPALFWGRLSWNAFKWDHCVYIRRINEHQGEKNEVEFVSNRLTSAGVKAPSVKSDVRDWRAAAAWKDEKVKSSVSFSLTCSVYWVDPAAPASQSRRMPWRWWRAVGRTPPRLFSFLSSGWDTEKTWHRSL